MAIVPARKRELRAQCSYVVMQLQKSAGSILASNKLARSAPKRVTARVNGGLGRRGDWHGSVSLCVARRDGLVTRLAPVFVETVQDRARPRAT